MQSLNIDMLKNKIRLLMKDKGVTQEDLSKELDMSQSNFSRALNTSKSQCFTLEQVYKLAQYFDISVDSLLGNTKATTQSSEKDICKLFTELIEARTLVTFENTRSEEIWSPNGYDCRIEHEDIKYNAFLFPNYFDPGPLDRFSEDQIDEMEMDSRYNGNADESNMRINAFFTRYLQIYNMFVHNQMSEDLFHEITEKFMQDLK